MAHIIVSCLGWSLTFFAKACRRRVTGHAAGWILMIAGALGADLVV